MATRVISIDLVGRDKASAVIRGVGTESEKAAAKSAAAFDASTTKIGRSVSTLGNTAAAMGVPFASSLSLIGTKFDQAGKQSKGFGSSISKLGAVEAVAAGAGIAVLATQVGSFISEGREALKVGRQTEAVLKSTGGVANVTAGEISSLAESLSKKAGVDDELIQSGENVLLTFTKVRNEAGKGNDIFNQGTEAALNMSAALGTDLQSNIIQVGKALNDPIKGITALSRVGVSFTKQQKEQVKALVESGQAMEAQKLILRELTTEFGGAAEAAADPFDKLKVQIDNVKEGIGLRLIPVIEDAGSAAVSMGRGFQSANDATGGLLGKTVALGAALPVAVFSIEKLAQAGGFVADKYGKVGQAVKAAADSTGLIRGAAEAAEIASANLTLALGQQAQAIARADVANKAYKAASDALAVSGQGNVTTAKALVDAASQQERAQARLASSTRAVAVAHKEVAAANAISAGGLSGNAVAMGVAAVAAGGLVIAWKALTEEGNKTKQAADDLTEAVTKQGQTLGTAAKQEVLDYVTEHAKARDVLDATSVSASQVANAVQRGGAAYDSVRAALKDYIGEQIQNRDDVAADSAQKLYNKIGQLRGGFVQAKGNIDGHNVAVGELKSTTGDATRATGGLTDAANQNTDATKKQNDAQEELLDTLKAVNDDLLAAADSNLALRQANNEVGESVLAAAEANREYGTTSQEATAANFSLESSILRAVGAAQRDAEASAKAKNARGANISAIEIENQKHNAAMAVLGLLKAQYPQLTGVIDKYRESLGLIPKDVATRLTLSISADGYRVPGTAIVRRASGGSVPGRGSGDTVPAMLTPGEYVVRSKAVQKYGVHTMELLNAGALPKFAGGGPVGTPRVSFPLGGSGGQIVHKTYNIEIKALDGRDAERIVVQAIRDYEDVNGPGSAGRR